MRERIEKGILIAFILWVFALMIHDLCSADDISDLRGKILKSGKDIALARQEQARLETFIKQETDKIIGYNAIIEHEKRREPWSGNAEEEVDTAGEGTGIAEGASAEAQGTAVEGAVAVEEAG